MGHQMGNYVLEVVARSAGYAIPEGDKLYRYGGDEFAVLLPDTELSVAADLAECIRDRVLRSSVIGNGAARVPVATSVGVAVKQPQTQSLYELLDAADQALYAVKLAGRNQVVVSSVSGCGMCLATTDMVRRI